MIKVDLIYKYFYSLCLLLISIYYDILISIFLSEIQHLLYNRNQLIDNKRLADYNIQDGSTIKVVLRLFG